MKTVRFQIPKSITRSLYNSYTKGILAAYEEIGLIVNHRNCDLSFKWFEIDVEEYEIILKDEDNASSS